MLSATWQEEDRARAIETALNCYSVLEALHGHQRASFRYVWHRSNLPPATTPQPSHRVFLRKQPHASLRPLASLVTHDHVPSF